MKPFPTICNSFKAGFAQTVKPTEDRKHRALAKRFVSSTGSTPRSRILRPVYLVHLPSVHIKQKKTAEDVVPYRGRRYKSGMTWVCEEEQV